jgi:hypothetical protein
MLGVRDQFEQVHHIDKPDLLRSRRAARRAANGSGIRLRPSRYSRSKTK